MKKRWMALLITASLAGCSAAPAASADFTFCGAQWGSSWEEVSETVGLTGETQESAGRQIVEIGETEFLGVTVEAALQFDSEESETPGLCNVAVSYQEEDEATLIENLEKLYGPRQTSYQDEIGTEIPLQPAGWVSEKTMDSELSEEEKDFVGQMNPDVESTRLDAVLRQPLVTIQLDEDENRVMFSGSTAAAVEYAKAQCGA